MNSNSKKFGTPTGALITSLTDPRSIFKMMIEHGVFQVQKLKYIINIDSSTLFY